ncbi:two-partner secretion domain-containing protein [Trinickia sp.]|uniref:two-partner secretion domain-containing protein n=1 Tax=Trinickia sp. TaxID=2571163 RepID=UPI003F7ED22B
MQPVLVEAQATLPIVPDRSSASHPVVGVSASGVPLINIVAPNRAGVSLNNFAHYNVGAQGAVIVNTPRSAQTQIAGWVQGNPLMGNSPARLVINQVTTGNPTRLLGITEVAGHRANVIIANPAGITCAGCGFINIPRISLTTGRPAFNSDGSLAGFDVTKGRLGIDGAGLDARGSAIDLIARAMQINGQVWADAIRTTAGANQVSYADGTTAVRAGEGEAPAFAIDVQALGGMYANSVRLIGTEAGVGVRSSGVIDSLTGDIVLSAKGDVTIQSGGRIQAADDARIDAPNLANQGVIVASQSVRLDARGALRNEGTVAAQSNVDLAASDVTNAGQIFAGVEASGALSGPGSVSLTGGNVLSNGTLAAGDNINVTGTAVSLDGGNVFAASALNVNGDDSLTTRGTTARAVNAALKSKGTLTNDEGVVAALHDAHIVARSASNREGWIGALNGALTASVSDAIDNTQGEMLAGGGVKLMASEGFINTKGIVFGGDVSLGTGHANIVNAEGAILATGRLESESGTFDNRSGLIRAGASAELDTHSGAFDNGLAKGSTVRGSVFVNGVALTMSGVALNNGGDIESDGDVNITARNGLANSGRIRARGDLNATSDGNVTNHGSMTARGTGNVSGRRIDNAAVAEIAGNARTHVHAKESLSNEGLIDGGRTHVDGKEVVDNRGRIYGDSVSIGARTVRNDANSQGLAGTIASRSDIHIGAKVTENAGGSLIYASNDLRVAGSLDADGKASDAWADRLTNTGSVVDAAGHVKIAATRFENLNANFQTEQITTDLGRQLWYTLPGSTERIDPSSIYFYQRNSHEVRPGTDSQWALDDDQKMLLRASNQYPFDEYAKYTINGVAGKIDSVHYPSHPSTLAYPGEAANTAESVGVFRTVPAEMWAKFGIEPPPPPPDSSYVKSGDLFVSAWGQQRRLGADWYTPNVPVVQSQQAGSPLPEMQSCLTAAADRCGPFKQWYDSLTQSYSALNRAVYDYNRNVESRSVQSWTIYDVNVKSTKDIVTSTQPGMITAGRGMNISARSGINDKSQMLAGGVAYVNDAIQDNSQPKGKETFDALGKAIHTWVGSGGAFRGDERKLAARDFAAPLPPREIDLPIAIATRDREPVKRIAANLAERIGSDTGRTIAASGDLFRTKGVALTPDAQAKLGPIEIRTVEPNIKLPNNALYKVVPDPGSRHLVETDPRFTNEKAWLSSEKMIAALSVDPSSVQKRLGDGFYEQQLIQQQIIQATGQRFIGDYADNQAAYQALMANGVKAAQQFDMNVGTALTDAQMAALTDDIVWLVNRTVALPDGTEQTVLVPQVYLRANAADVTGTGSIIAGKGVVLNNKGTLANSGTIASRTMTIVTADSITNVGVVAGQTVQAEARQDLVNLGGLIQGNTIGLSAGRDVSLASTTQSATTANGSATAIDRTSQINAGTLTVRAGRDLNADAAQVVSSGDVSLAAQRDVNLSALRERNDDHVRWDDKNRAEHSASIDIGTAIQSGGNIGIVSGRDFNATAAGVVAQGDVNAVAGRDVHLYAGERSASAYDEHHVKESGMLSSKSTHTIDASRYTDAIGTLLSGDTVQVMAGNDLTARAATIAGTRDVRLNAGNDLSITTADTLSSEYHFKDVKKSGLGTAGAGISYGTNQTIDTSLDREKGSRGSLIGSLDGNVSMRAGNKLRVTGSDVLAAGNVTGVAKEVKVDASQTDRHRHETHEVKSSGFTLAAKSSVTDAMQNVNQQARGAGQSQDGRAAALHGIAAAGGVADLVGAGADMASSLAQGGKPEGKIELSFGSSRSKTTYTQDSTLSNGSHVKAGGRVAFVATGDKEAGQGNVTIEGSDVMAKDVVLSATNKVNLASSTDTERVRSTNESQSGSVGVSFGSNGWGVSAAMSRAQGYANSDATMRNNTHIAASNTVTIVSGGDTDIMGANVSARKVIADIGGNLNIASVQDTVHSVAQQRSVGGGFSISQGGGSASFSMQNGRASGKYAGVSEQSGIQAGEGGFDIKVKGNTDLKGAYIASDAEPEKNQLTTGTLSFSDIRNGSAYDANSVGVSAGGSVGDGGNNYATHGPTRGKNAGGALPMAVNDSGSSEALTKSAVSAGSITIVDEANQKQDVAMLSRDTSNLNGTVDNLPDLQSVLANQSDLIDAAGAAAETVAKQIGAYADKKQREALEAAERETDPNLLERYWQAAKDWGEGGDYRAGLHIAGGALTGGLTGGGGGAVGGAVGAGLSAKLAPQLKEVAQAVRDAGPTGNGDVDQLVGNVISNVLAGGVGAAAGESTGALAGAVTDRFNRQLSPDEKKAIKKGAGDDKDFEKRLTRAACYEVKCWAQYKPGSAEYTANYVSQLEASQLQAEFDWVEDQKQAGLFDYTPLQKVGDAIQRDPMGVAKDAFKVAVGGVAVKTGATICTATGVGCSLGGGGMVLFGLSDMAEGAGGLYNRYSGIASPGLNPLRSGLNQLSPTWGDTAYDGASLLFALGALRAEVPLKMGVADGLNRPGSMFGVTVPRINNPTLVPFVNQALPHGTTKGILLYGIGSKGVAVTDDIRNAGDKK